jgi:Na+-transporting NADH:ubiquinone oxidoreductase subunit C
MASAKDGTFRTLVVATLLCVACSLLVSTAAVILYDVQESEKRFDRQRNILQAAGLVGKSATKAEVAEKLKSIQTKAVDLATGTVVEDFEVEGYEQREAEKDPQRSVTLTGEEDLGNIRRRVKVGLVYLVTEGGQLRQVVLPIHGMGLWGILYGFLAVDADLETVGGLVYYEHKETPGLGGEVDNERWKALWPGKKLYDAEGNLKVEVVKGAVVGGRPEAIYQVDGLAGATITSRGVTNMLRYWLGPGGYGPFLAKLRSKDA